MLNFNNVTKIFKSDIINQPFVALKDVSFEIPQGAMVGFLGANGAGKTTSLKIIMDFIRPDLGEIKFSPLMGKSRAEVFKKIGFLPERPYFYPNLTGFEFLNFLGQLSEISKTDLNNQIKIWAPRFKIDHALQRKLRTYSKGMLQRIGFMATILHRPEFILLDEPLSGLDPIGRKELKDVIVEVHKEGKTVFFSSHIVSDIEEICDRVIFLKEGKLVYNGKVDDLIRSGSQTEFVLKFSFMGKVQVNTAHRDYVSYSENFHSLKVEDSMKAGMINELLKYGADIVSIELVRPSLEQIFYNIKNKI